MRVNFSSQVIREALNSFTSQGEAKVVGRLGKGKAKSVLESGTAGAGATEAAHALWICLISEWAGHQPKPSTKGRTPGEAAKKCTQKPE